MNETFIFGKDATPAWFDEAANMGRVRTFYDDDNKLVRARIKSGITEYVAEIGDSIMNTKSGLVVIKEDKAKRYKVQNQKEEKKVEKENEDE